MKKRIVFASLLLIAALAGCTVGNGGAQTPAAESTSAAAVAQTETPQASVEAQDSPAETPKATTETALTAYQAISPADAKALIGTEGVVLLDVRTKEEFDEAHIEGAMLLPYNAIAQNADKLPQDKDATLIVYCRSGRRSAIAAETLIGMGYTNIYDLGGIQDWPYDTVTG